MPPSQIRSSVCSISAKNRAQAVAHAVKDTITVAEADVPDAMRLAAAGVTLEQAEAA